MTLVLALSALGCAGDGTDSASGALETTSAEAVPAAVEPAAAPGPLTAADQAALDNPCSVLSASEVRQITGRQDYDEGSPGDELGQGAGGGASCQWSGPVFGGPPERAPVISVIVVPPRDGRRWTDNIRASPRPDCTHDAASGAGQGAFFEECPNRRELPLYVPARAVDVIAAIEILPPATSASVRPTLEQVANAAVANLR
jgi:hypothetical protein